MSKYDVKRMSVTLGDHRIRDYGDEQQRVRVLRVIRHKRFSTSTLVRNTDNLMTHEHIYLTLFSVL